MRWEKEREKDGQETGKEKEKSRSRRIAKCYFEFHSNATWNSEINQIQLHNSDYRVRNLIYLRVIVPPFVLRYRIPLDAVNGTGGTSALLE